LWSLGVEEQFYIVWPGFILLAVKHFRDNISKALAIFTICSFAFSIYTVYGNAQFAFYFPLCRFWQMAIGGLLVLNKSRLKDTSINNLLSGIGISAILITPFMISEDSLFPGWWSLSPSLGAALVIKAGSQSIISKYLLSNRVFLFLGKISYPMYLWHWPLLVYAR